MILAVKLDASMYVDDEIKPLCLKNLLCVKKKEKYIFKNQVYIEMYVLKVSV